MLFNSFEFLVFFPVVVAFYFVVPKKIRYLWLLAASYYFYMSWLPAYGVLLFGCTLVTYLAGLIIGLLKKRENGEKGEVTAQTKKGLKAGRIAAVAISCIIVFAALFTFKYFGFFFDSVESICLKLGVDFSKPVVSLVLPVGISFYTFQAVGYVIDVYRGKIDAEKNFFRYALFVSFFPQLVAGPIERSDNLLKQLREVHTISLWKLQRIEHGIIYMIYGYVLKMIISDRAKIFVDEVYSAENYSNYAGIIPAVATILFAIQIYCDFAGYTAIAIGAAKVMGFDLMENFNTPYLAISIRDFWSRWHISLTQWFRDYLYIPLGGNRKGKVRKYLNIFIVFALSGLWHGASWHFVIWGVLHGILRIADDITFKTRKKFYDTIGATNTISHRVFQILGTFFFVCMAWVFFRAESVGQAVDIIKNTFTVWNPWVLTDGTLLSTALDPKEWNVLFAALAFLLLTEIAKYKKFRLAEKILSQGFVFKGALFIIGVLAILIFGIYGADYDAASFIYFRF